MNYTDTMQLETTGLPKEKPVNHQVLVVRIPEPRVHTNADTLELFDILNYQVVAKKGNFKAGELAVYVQPDSVVPQTEPFKWIWETYVGVDGIVPERRRRITVRKFRKEWSEGLLVPITDFINEIRNFAQAHPNDPRVIATDDGARMTFRIGDDVSDILNITHWEGETESDTFGRTASAPKQKRRPKTVLGWLRYFYYNAVRVLSGGRMYRRESSMEVTFHSPEYDVVAMKAARSGFAPDEQVTVTEKLHGSNGRFLFLEGVFYIGSHFQWKAPDTPCIFTRVAEQNPWIEEWCRANEGNILYGEVIGDQKGYTYGMNKQAGQLDFRVFDIWTTNGWIKPWAYDNSATGGHVLNLVPLLYTGPADMEKIKALTDGLSAIDGKTQREGVVVSELNPAADGHRRPRQVKRVSNVFLEKDAK